MKRATMRKVLKQKVNMKKNKYEESSEPKRVYDINKYGKDPAPKTENCKKKQNA